jgi:hypothetical protein
VDLRNGERSFSLARIPDLVAAAVISAIQGRHIPELSFRLILSYTRSGQWDSVEVEIDRV